MGGAKNTLKAVLASSILAPGTIFTCKPTFAECDDFARLLLLIPLVGLKLGRNWAFMRVNSATL